MGNQKYCKDHYDRLTELALVVHKLWKRGVDVSSWAIQKREEYRKFASAAYHKGITWEEVLVAAGLSLDEVIKERREWSMDHYDRLTELALIVYKLWIDGVDVSTHAISQNAEHRKFISAGGALGISWQEVLVAAGLSLDEVIRKKGTREWSKDHYERLTELALIVHKLWIGGVDVSICAILKNAEYRKFVSAAYNKGITWEEVLVAAGLPLDEIIKERREWSKDHYDRLTELALIVHKLWIDGVDVTANAIINSVEYRKLISAATYVGITWQEVLVAAGIPTKKIIKKDVTQSKYSKDHYDRLTEIALIVHKLWRSGVDVSARAILKNAEHRKFYGAAGYVGITWQEVLVAAGIPLNEVMKK